MGEGYTPPVSGGGSGGGSLLKVVRVTLNAAALAAINGTLVTAIPALGASKAAIVSGPITVETAAGTTPYTLYAGNFDLIPTYSDPNLPITTLPLAGLFPLDDFFSPNKYPLVSPGPPSGQSSRYYNTAIVLDASDNGGRIATSSLNAAGLGYAPGDTFGVDFGNTDATGVIDTVGVGGAVLTYHIVDKGSNYFKHVGRSTTATTGIGTGFKITISAVQTVAGGDGTIILSIPYYEITG